MKSGKIAEPILKRSVLKKIAYKSKTVLSKAAVGHDSAVVSLEDNVQKGNNRMVTSTATVIAKRDYITIELL